VSEKLYAILRNNVAMNSEGELSFVYFGGCL
jgi:hypothetical protein